MLKYNEPVAWVARIRIHSVVIQVNDRNRRVQHTYFAQLVIHIFLSLRSIYTTIDTTSIMNICWSTYHDLLPHLNTRMIELSVSFSVGNILLSRAGVGSRHDSSR